MENENKRIIEVNGVKMEIDLRQAKVIDNYKVGDKAGIMSVDLSSSVKVN